MVIDQWEGNGMRSEFGKEKQRIRNREWMREHRMNPKVRAAENTYQREYYRRNREKVLERQRQQRQVDSQVIGAQTPQAPGG